MHVALTCETRWALACVDCNGIMTDATITTWVALTVIDVNLAAVTSETNRAYTSKCVYQIIACAPVQTRIQLTLINVNLTLRACETCNKPRMLPISDEASATNTWIQVHHLNQSFIQDPYFIRQLLSHPAQSVALQWKGSINATNEKTRSGNSSLIK